MEEYAIEQQIKVLEKIVYAPTLKAHSIAKALLVALNNKLKQE